MEKISSSLDKTLNKLGIKKKVREEMALYYWKEVAGPKISSKARAEFIKNGILFVGVTSSVWSQQLFFFKDNLIKKLNQRLGDRVVKDIYFRGCSFPKAGEITREQGEGDFWKEEVLAEEEWKAIEENLKEVKEVRIREAMKNIMVREAKIYSYRKKMGWAECENCKSLYLPHRKEKKCPLCK